MSYWENYKELLPEKSRFLNHVFDEKLTIDITDYVNVDKVENDILFDALGDHIKDFNEVDSSDKNYFVFNNKIRVKKRAFLKEILTDDCYKKEIEAIRDTTGRLFITIDFYWFLRCSDPDYVSWSSCFAPNGCYHLVPYEFATGKGMMMAMITNTDMTRIIGRKWIAIPEDKKNYEKVREILCLKSYGTFPILYQQGLTRWIIEHIFNDKKENWKVYSYKSDQEIISKLESNVSVERVCGGGRYKKLFVDSERKPIAIYFDPASYILIPKEINCNDGIGGLVIFRGIDEEDDDDDDIIESDDYDREYVNEDDDYYGYCEWCGDRWPVDQMHEVYSDDSQFAGVMLVCEECVDDCAVYDEVNMKWYEADWFNRNCHILYVYKPTISDDHLLLWETVSDVTDYPELNVFDENGRCIFRAYLLIPDVYHDQFMQLCSNFVTQIGDDEYQIRSYHPNIEYIFPNLIDLSGLTPSLPKEENNNAE